MPGRLEGKVCVVTGTGGGMGRATALTFAREGALVVGCDVAVEPAEQTVKLVHAAGGTMTSLHPLQLGDSAGCARLVEYAVGEFGRIDVLFNLAGRTHFGWLQDVTDDDWAAARDWPAVAAAAQVVSREFTSAPMTSTRRVSATRGTSANGIPKDSTTCESTRLVVGGRPTVSTMRAGSMVSPRRTNSGTSR